MKRETNVDRHGRVSTSSDVHDDDQDHAEFADARDEEENLSRRSARSRSAAVARSPTRGAARDLREDRDARSERERVRRVGTFLGGWRQSMTGEAECSPFP